MANTNKPELLSVGVVGRPRGLRGELRIQLFDPESEALAAAESVVLSDPKSDAEKSWPLLKTNRGAKGGRELFVRLEGVNHRDVAETLRGHEVLVPRASLPATESDEYYDFDLIGLTVRSPEGADLGEVVSVEHPPANDVLVLQLLAGQGFMDVPLLESIVHEIDIEGGTLTATVPEGFPTRPRR